MATSLEAAVHGVWLAAHPYLEPIAKLQAAVHEAVDATVPASLSPPPRAEWDAAVAAGTTLLSSATYGAQLRSLVAELLPAAALKLQASSLPWSLHAALSDLREKLSGGPEVARKAAAWVLDHGEQEEAPAHPGLLRLLGWAITQRLLAQVQEALRPGGDAPAWTKGHCPCCGALPATAQLLERGGGRVRLLGCGLCGTQWRFSRVGCPHCGNEQPSKLEVLEVEGEDALRLDTCRECKGYVKTDLIEGREELTRADWPTLHLDALAADRGLERFGPALFEP